MHKHHTITIRYLQKQTQTAPQANISRVLGGIPTQPHYNSAYAFTVMTSECIVPPYAGVTEFVF